MAARRTRQISIKECYDILHLQKGADLQAVKSAYRRRAFELHPDLNPGNAEASRQFQRLNEAYVALSSMLKATENAKQKTQFSQSTKQQESAEKNTRSQDAETTKEKNPGAERDATRASQAYSEQDVLRDLLNDPFARRVFEDIYSELNRKEGSQKPSPEPSDQTEKKASPQQEPRTVQAEPFHERKKSNSGFFSGLLRKVLHPKPHTSDKQKKESDSAFVDWLQKQLRKQLDDEQILRMPAAQLRPGATVRLHIRKSNSDDLTAVDVRLPADFAIGKPIRLKGLGGSIGSVQGDLYLTIYNK